jgi:hypothetical protein
VKNNIDIQLPRKTRDVIVTVAFAYGFLSESTASFGMGHLAEHCLCAQLKQDKRFKDAWGHIDDRNLVINMRLSRAHYKKLLEEGILKTILETARSISPAILKTEKLRICAEIDERYNSTIPFISEYVKGALIKGPRKLARVRVSQLKVLRKASMKNLSKTLGSIVSKPHRVFVGGSGAVSAKGGRDGAMPTARALAPRLDVIFSEKRHFKLRPHKTESAFIIAFRIPGIETSLERGLMTGFVADEVYEAFRDIAHAQGAYEPYYEIRIEREYGIVWFGLYSRAKISSDIGTSFCAMVDSVLKSKGLDAKLKAYKRDKAAQMKADWIDPAERQDWIVEDSIEGRKISDLAMALDILKGITVEKARAVGREVFDAGTSYTFK